MALPKRRRISNKAIRIIHREVNRLDLVSVDKGLDRTEIDNLVKLFKALEIEATEEKKIKDEVQLTEEQQKQAYELLKQKFEK